MTQQQTHYSMESPSQNNRRSYATANELKQQAIRLGLPAGPAVLPEQEISPHYGDPTLVDDRPFALALH